MAKSVFITKIDPAYNDLPEVQYHFPRTYLNVARETIGDWILYYEPRRASAELSSTGGRQVYFATARVVDIVEDPQADGHYYAMVADYIEFPNPVPYREGDHYWESRLRKEDGSVNKGLFGRAIHQLPDDEYQLILQRGFGTELLTPEGVFDTAEMIAEAPADYGREVVQRTINQKVRDAAFATVVRQAYDSTCAFTDLKLVNGGDKCEIEAAHIRPVAECGPDSPRNGLALSRTCHWMFDRGILSLEDDGKILMADKLVPDPVKRMIRPEGYIHMPESCIWHPHAQYLRFHRENVFKG